MVKEKIKNIVILGAGFAGLNVAQVLSKKLKDPKYKITLVDKSPYHVYTPNLYETATAYTRKISPACAKVLKDSVAMEITSLINGKKITFTNDEVIGIDPKKKNISLKNHSAKIAKNAAIHYDILVLALGAATNYFNIPGLKENSYPLKTVEDALKINCDLNQYFFKTFVTGSTQKPDSKPVISRFKPFTVTIGGGGATGVETSAEMRGFLNHLAKKYHYPKDKLEIQLMEAGQTLAGLDEKGTEIIKKRFKKLNIDIHLKSPIQKAAAKEIFTLNEGKDKNLPTDFLIWTGGVIINPLIQKVFGTEKTHGAIEVNEFLQSIRHPEVFAAGDNAYFTDPKDITKRLPLLAQFAFQQGRFLAKNIIRYLKKEPLKIYHPAPSIYLLPIGGRFAIMKIGSHTFKGRLLYYLRRLVDFRYTLMILPFFRALRKWLHSHKVFLKND